MKVLIDFTQGYWHPDNIPACHATGGVGIFDCWDADTAGEELWGGDYLVADLDQPTGILYDQEDMVFMNY